MNIETEHLRRYDKPVDLTNAAHSTPAETARLLPRRRAVFLCGLGWTLLVCLALWWLLRGNVGPSVWIVHEGDSVQPAFTEKYRVLVRPVIGFQRIYPWALFGPYVVLIALYFPLERNRLRLSLPLNVAACAAFIGVSQAINARTSIAYAKGVMISSQRKADAPPGSQGTNRVQFEIIKTDPGSLWHRPNPSNLAGEEHALVALAEPTLSNRQDRLDASLTNLVAHLPPGLQPPLTPPPWPRFDLLYVLLDLVAYSALVGLAHSVHFYRRFREREHKALVLESNLAHSRLSALRAQLQPHFLFNSLNAIAALLRRDPRLAEATLLSLSELLRLSLSQSQRQEVPLREEMQFVQRYLEIQQTRFGDKLRIEQDIEPATLDCSVPTLLLQPLVENAIRHGIEPAANAGLVRLTARRWDEGLVLTVEDDGVGLTSPAIDLRGPKAVAPSRIATYDTPAVPDCSRNGTGIGLANLQARLQALYGTGQSLELIPRPEGGVIARIKIPWRPVTPPEVADAFTHS